METTVPGEVAGRRGAAHELTEFLARVSAASTKDEVLRLGAEGAATMLQAEISAVVRDGRVLVSAGFPAGAASEEELLLAAAAPESIREFPGLGRIRISAVSLRCDPPTCLLVGRRGEQNLSPEELALLRNMGRVLELTLRLVRGGADERRQAEENARLLESLRGQQSLLEQLARIQRTISDRTRLQEVLDAIVEGAAELLASPVVGLRLIDPNDPAFMIIAASCGLDPVLGSSIRRAPVGEGAGGRAITEGNLVVINDYAAIDHPVTELAADGLRAAMAVPLLEQGTVVGSLVVSTYDSGRTYEDADAELLVQYAEQAELALAAARTGDTMRQAFNDSLTGLANRALFLDRLERAQASAGRTGAAASVLFLDVDSFKLVNDSLGHLAGDRLLVEVADRLRECLRTSDTAARLGGDEFAILIAPSTDPFDPCVAAERIIAALAPPFTIHDRELFITASIGIAKGIEPAEVLLRNADVAMYRAKSERKGSYAVFKPEMHAAVVERMEMRADLQRALEREELFVLYQPIVQLETGALAGVEALVRWQHPSRGVIGPLDFIPVAEETGLIHRIGDFVLRCACTDLTAWRCESKSADGLFISVNVSGQQLQPGLPDRIGRVLTETGVDARVIVLEITETILMQDTETMLDRLKALKELGLRLAIDDFGTGYSSLSYLQRFPADMLKVAKPFVDAISNMGADEPTLARTIVNLARALRLCTVAEGIEEPVQHDELRRMGCELGQGFLFAHPLSAEQIHQYLVAPPGSRHPRPRLVA